MPSLHPQQVPTAVRPPNGGVRLRALRFRRPASAGVTRPGPGGGRCCRVHVPDRARHPSGLVGPVGHPDLGADAGRAEPRRCRAVGHHATFRSSRTSRSSSTAAGGCSTGIGRRRWAPIGSRARRLPPGTDGSRAGRARGRGGRVQGVRPPGRGHARWHPGCVGVRASTGSRSTTRRSSCATSTRSSATGSPRPARARWSMCDRPPCPRVRRSRAVRRHLVPRNRTRTLGNAAGEHHGRADRVLRRRSSPSRRGDRALRPIPARRASRRRQAPAATHPFPRHGGDGRRDLRPRRPSTPPTPSWIASGSRCRDHRTPSHDPMSLLTVTQLAERSAPK